MKNSIKIFFIFSLLNLYLFSNASSEEIFKFEVSEIEITQNGNLIKGYNGGKAKQIAKFPIHTQVNDMQISEDMQMVYLNYCLKQLWKLKKIKKK